MGTIDHKSIGKQLKEIRRTLMSLSTSLQREKKNKGKKPYAKMASKELTRTIMWPDRARAHLDSQHSIDDRENFDTHTYYGEDR